MKRKYQTKSILEEVLVIFFTILCSVMISLCLFFYISTIEKKIHTTMVERSTFTNSIYIELTKMEENMNSYGRTLENQYLEAYLGHSDRLEYYLSDLKKISSDRQKIMDYIRRIESFNHYQKKLWEEAQNELLYSNVTYLRMGLTAQKVQAQNLIIEDLDYTTKEYLQKVEVLNKSKFIIWFCIIVMIASCSVLVIRRLNKMIMVLKENRAMAKALTRHQWDVADVQLGYYSEFDELSIAMNQMKHEIKQHIEQMKHKNKLEKQLHQERLENERKDRALVEVRLSTLRAEINPHFLFNALNLIGKTAFLEQPEITMDLIEAISKILRYSLEQSGHMVMISQEMEIVNAYIFLQKTRFGKNVTYLSEIPKEAEFIRIPPMIIQPIIENSFKHGFKRKNSIAISVNIQLEEDFVILTIQDDGEGFDTSILDQMVSSGIGVKNVQQRLELEYKSGGLFEIESQCGLYTKVTIRIPREEQDEGCNCRR